ncbi:MAG: hypothetical protein ABIT23_04925, partial [Nitrosospira sp.]
MRKDWEAQDSAVTSEQSVLALQQHYRPRRHRQPGASLKRCRIIDPAPYGIEYVQPAWGPAGHRQGEIQRFVVGVEDQVETVIDNRLAAGIGVGDGLAIDENRQALGHPSTPWLLARLLAGMTEPC